MPVRARPLSPHLGIYRWQMGNSLSILHRGTGIALAFGLLALCYWFVSLAGGETEFAAAMRIFSSAPGMIVIAGWTFSFLYHLLNGIRHLCWDAGYGFERGVRRASGWAAVACAVLLTAGVCWLMWHGVRS